MRVVNSSIVMLLCLESCCAMESCLDIKEEPQHSGIYCTLNIPEKISEIDCIENSQNAVIQADDVQKLSKIKEECVVALKQMKLQAPSTVLMADCDAVNNIIFRINELLRTRKFW